METYVLLSLLGILFLIVGWYASQQVKDFKGFILARKAYGVFALTATITASFVGGGFVIGSIEKSCAMGIAPAFALLGFSLQLFLTGYLFCQKTERFKDCYSVGDIISKHYGKRAQVFVGLLWISFSIGIVTAQLSAMGKVLDLFTDLSYMQCVALSAFVVISYCLMGGIRAVVATDMIQFLMIIIVLPLALLTTVDIFGIGQNPAELIPAHYFTLPGHWGWNGLIFAFLGFVFGDALIAPVVQRILMAKSQAQAQSAFKIAGLITIPLCLIATFIGIYTCAIHTSLEPNASMSFFLNEHFSGWGRALVISAFMAVIISSADTYLNSTASVLVNDVIHPLKADLADKTLLQISRLFTLFIGLISVFFALYVQNIFDLLLYTYKFWGPIVLIPLVSAFWGLSLSEKKFFSISGTGGSIVVVWNLFDLETVTGINDLFAGLLASLFTFGVIYFTRRSTLKESTAH